MKVSLGTIHMMHSPGNRTTTIKARPCVVVCRIGSGSFLMAPLSTSVSRTCDQVVEIQPSERNNLGVACYANPAWFFTAHRPQIGRYLGRLEPGAMAELYDVFARSIRGALDTRDNHFRRLCAVAKEASRAG